MAEQPNFMRAPAPVARSAPSTRRRWRSSIARPTLIGLDKRVRLELEEPDYEHIFYVTTKLKDRLRAAGPAEAAKAFADLPVTQVRNPDGLERLADGQDHPQRQGAARLGRRHPPRATCGCRTAACTSWCPASRALQGVPRAAQPGARPVQGRHPLPPRGLARPVQGARRGDDLEDGDRRGALRRRQGRHPDRPAPVRQGGAAGHHPALHVQAQEPDRPQHRHPRAGRGHQRGDHGADAAPVHATASASGTTCAASSPARTCASAAPRAA